MSDMFPDEIRMPNPPDIEAWRAVQNLTNMRLWDDPASPDTIRRLVRGWGDVLPPQLRGTRMQEIMERYSRPLLATAWRLVEDYEQAADLVQEAWVKLFQEYMRRNAAVIRLVDDETCDSQELYRWLLVVVSHAARDHLRKPRPVLLDVVAWERVGNQRPSESALDNVLRMHAYGILNEAIQDGLKPVQRQALILRYGHGYSEQEVSDILGVPLNTTKSYIRRAKERIQSACREQDITYRDFVA